MTNPPQIMDSQLLLLHEEYCNNPIVKEYIANKHIAYTMFLLEGWSKLIGYSLEELEFDIEELQYCILDAPRVHKERTLYRGLIKDFIGDSQEIQLKNFSSSSSLLKVAKDFVGKDGILLELHTPPDLPMLYTGSAANQEEEEYILPIGINIQIFEVTTIDKIKTYRCKVTF